MSRWTPIACSPIAAAPPVGEVGGWRVSMRRSDAALTLSDQTPLAKVHVRASEDLQAFGVGHGLATRDHDGNLVVGSGPGEWLVLGPVGSAAGLVERLRPATSPAAGAGELVTVVDLTHGRALMRLTGSRSPDLLAKVCAIDLRDATTPNGAAFRSSVARLVTDVIRDDLEDVRSYLLHCEMSSGQYLFDALLDAGGEFAIDVEGLHHRRSRFSGRTTGA